jgi:pimeloyl-ACP methyl ester carboxylesterase
MQAINHRFVNVDGLDIFYRESGPPDAPAILLLHGSPSSSIQFRNLFPALSDQWRLIAPDLPSFGLSAAPDPANYTYSFENLATTIKRVIDLLHIDTHALYLHDYGAQVGYRLVSRREITPKALIIQNSEAYYSEGRSNAWGKAEEFWRDPSSMNRNRARAKWLNEETTRREFLEDLAFEIRELIDPSIVRLAWYEISRPGVAEGRLDLHLDYQTNVDHYRDVQAYFREQQPSTLILWGREDQYYSPEAAYAYLQDLPHAQVHILDGGHWVLESHGRQVAELSEPAKVF